jgi:hypothetical protein
MIRRIEEGTTTAGDAGLFLALLTAAFAVGVLVGVVVTGIL